MRKAMILTAILLSVALSVAAQSVWFADVTVQWDEAQFATGYNVFYGPTSSPEANIVDAGANTQTVIKNIPAGYLYVFKVQARNAYGEGPMSDPAQADLRKPGKPGNNRIVNIDGHK